MIRLKNTTGQCRFIFALHIWEVEYRLQSVLQFGSVQTSKLNRIKWIVSDLRWSRQETFQKILRDAGNYSSEVFSAGLHLPQHIFCLDILYQAGCNAYSKIEQLYERMMFTKSITMLKCIGMCYHIWSLVEMSWRNDVSNDTNYTYYLNSLSMDFIGMNTVVKNACFPHKCVGRSVWHMSGFWNFNELLHQAWWFN